MGLLGMFWKLEKKVPWGPVGIIVAIAIGVPALYASLHEKEASIAYEIINESNVFSLHKPLDELTITFQNEDVVGRRSRFDLSGHVVLRS